MDFENLLDGLPVSPLHVEKCTVDARHDMRGNVDKEHALWRAVTEEAEIAVDEIRTVERDEIVVAAKQFKEAARHTLGAAPTVSEGRNLCIGVRELEYVCNGNDPAIIGCPLRIVQDGLKR